MPFSAGVGRGLLGLGIALALGGSPPPIRADDASAVPPRIFHRSRSFRIPFDVDPADKSRLREVQLWASSDRGGSWDLINRVAPDQVFFNFRASEDGEYWFAVRTQDLQGRLYPADNRDVEAKLKVVVDTVPPSLVLEVKRRRGSQVVLRHEARDENLDLSKLHIEYQTEGADSWRSVPLRRPVLATGESAFDAYTADVLNVRGSVVDRAGNVRLTEIVVPEGLPDGSELAGQEEPFEVPAPPPIAPIVRNTGRPAPSPTAGLPLPDDPPPLEEPSAGPDFAAGGGQEEPLPARESGETARLLIGSPRFPLKYAVEDAGPGGPATVELWVTRDGGRNWHYLGQDPDRTSPFQVELPGDGSHGLRIVARSASGLGDQPPRSGDPPEVYVEVDTTPPLVRMGPVQLLQGNGESAVRLTWKAEDAHLGAKPVVISYRPDRPDGIWQQITPSLPNTGQYVWKLPPNLPGRVHFRVDVIDTLDNRGWAETPEGSPVVVDRSRPRGRILGLERGTDVRSGATAAGEASRY